jgi:selenide,water dikinase
MSTVQLTHFSRGAGCGCKIAPAVLEKILHAGRPRSPLANLLVGYETKDDAAVWDMGNGTALISTTDFFMPVVDDAFDFGAIAAANAISDVYAMGGKPVLALAILGWPVEKLPADLAARVLDGAREVCAQAGIALAGGHSVDSAEPFFGLAVNGTVAIAHLKKNSTAGAGDYLYLSKPLGLGMVTTAHKRGVADTADVANAVKWMKKLNSLGAVLGEMPAVTALTDVTGFGLLGHLVEVCEGSGLSAVIDYKKVPLLPCVPALAAALVYPDNTMRNWSSYETRVEGVGSESLLTLCDPQTNGGLLVCVKESARLWFEQQMNERNQLLHHIGQLTERRQKTVIVQNGV